VERGDALWLPGSAQAEAYYQRGLARYYMGDLLAAEQDLLEAAARGRIFEALEGIRAVVDARAAEAGQSERGEPLPAWRHGPSEATARRVTR
jgi:hypothetical protein